MGARARLLAALAAVFAALVLLHLPLLHLPYFWDEAGYYIPAAFDFYRHGLLIPRSTLPSGHTPLVPVYLGIVWRLFGFSEVVTRAAMLLIAAAAVVTTCALGSYAAGRQAGLWSGLLLALSPLFFAQSSLVFLDLTAACFTGLAVLFMLQERWALFAASAAAALVSKETAVVMLPVMGAFMLLRREDRRAAAWAALIAPLFPLGLWSIYYHHSTGFWTGNTQYLQYNLYSALAPLHVARSFVARTCEVFVLGFNWLLTAGAVAGIWYARRPEAQDPRHKAPHGSSASAVFGIECQTAPGIKDQVRRHPAVACAIPLAHPRGSEAPIPSRDREGAVAGVNGGRPAGIWHDFKVLAIALIAAYILMLSFVGGAVLSRYMLPVLPLFLILSLGAIRHLPGFVRQAIGVAVAVCFVAAWFINPPYPFPYENNLSYVDFIRLHQQAAHYLESVPGTPVILTAWPATDELRQPFLGYVRRPLHVAQVENFAASAFNDLPRFDLLYVYSRKWAPKHNLLTSMGPARGMLEHFYDYQPPLSMTKLAAERHLKLLKLYQRRGQWVRIYARE
jgi:hypothetical protein